MECLSLQPFVPSGKDFNLSKQFFLALGFSIRWDAGDYVSFENNGGFASVRCQPMDLGRKDVAAYLLEVCGDGKRYKLNLRTDNSFDGVNYQAQFHPPAGIWTTCRLARADFLPSWRGKSVPDAPPLDNSWVRQIGLMIADRQEGPFALAVRSMAAEIG